MYIAYDTSRLQKGQTSHVIDNIHGIFAAAASQFTLDQFSAFTKLIASNWCQEKDSMKEKNIYLLGLIGRDTRSSDLAHKVHKQHYF